MQIRSLFTLLYAFDATLEFTGISSSNAVDESALQFSGCFDIVVGPDLLQQVHSTLDDVGTAAFNNQVSVSVNA